LMEYCCPWYLIERVGVHSQQVHQQVLNVLPASTHKPQVEIIQAWYYR
jgi:hypothetical protein